MTMFLHAAHGCAPLATGRRSPMLQLSLRPGEYLTIHGDIVVQLAQLSGSRAFLRVEADRSIPIGAGKGTGAVGGSPAGVPGISSPQPRQERPGCRLPLECGAGAGRPHNGTAPGADGGRGQPGGSPGAAGTVGAPASNCMGGGAVRPNTGPVPQQNSPGRIKNHLSLGFTRSREPVEINRSAGTQPAKGHGVCVGLPNH